jgi:GDP/UDP-N,N'-diacetylbacillosamine 2-epimerase (hydrolysing)
MGERSETIWVVGAPGLDGLLQSATLSRAVLCQNLGFDVDQAVALVVFHPVLQEAEQSADAMRLILDCLVDQKAQAVVLMPNSDAGSDLIRQVLFQRDGHDGIRVLTHLARSDFASWMAQCDVMIGNSSAGIIEAATFGTPVLNLGDRQRMRERNANTMDVPLERAALLDALRHVRQKNRFLPSNLYGDGRTAQRIADLLENMTFTPELLLKTNAY